VGGTYIGRARRELLRFIFGARHPFLLRLRRVMALVTVTACALIAVTLVPAPDSSAARLKVDATGYSVFCNHVAGSLAFSSPFTNTSIPKFYKVSGSLSGCTTVTPQGQTPVSVTSGTFSERFRAGEFLCDTIWGNTQASQFTEPGNLKVRWRASQHVRLQKTVFYTLYKALGVNPGSQVATLTMPGAFSQNSGSVTGSFSRQSRYTFIALSTRTTVSAIESECAGTGVRQLPLIGVADFGTPPSSLALSPANVTVPFSQCEAGVGDVVFSAFGSYPGASAVNVSPFATWSVSGDLNLDDPVVGGNGVSCSGNQAGIVSVNLGTVSASTSMAVS